MKEVIEK